jgi:hypothetical protein
VSSQSLLIMTSREGHRGDINRNTMKLSLLWLLEMPRHFVFKRRK